MENRRQRPIYFTVLILLLVTLTGNTAEASTGSTAETSPGNTAEASTEKTGEEQGTRQKASRLSAGEKHMGADGEETGGVESLSPSSAPLAVTDHRINSSAVQEYADRETFLCEYGFDGEEPYFEYYTEEGALQLELYYDVSCGVGCGLQYYPGEDMEPEGFIFNGSNNYRYYKDFMGNGGIDTDRYSISSFDGSDGKSDVEDYEESVLYREDGRPARYISQGWITYLTDKKEISKIMEIEWSYREDGSLRERDYWHNSMVFGTWYSSRRSYYDEGERLLHEHCYVTHGYVDYYYIYAGESEIPAYCLIIDHNLNLLCAELLEYHDAGTGAQGGVTDAREPETDSDGMEMYYGRIGPGLAGETENRYAAAVIELAEKEGKNYEGYVTHTYAADYDGDFKEEAFVIFGEEINNEYEYGILGDCWFVNSDLEVSLCIDRAYSFDRSQQFICQDGSTYLLIRYSIGMPWQAEMYTVRGGAPVEISGSYADKYVDSQGQVIQIENSYDGNCMRTNVSGKPGEEDWEYLWTGHSWKPYTFLLDHGELREVPAREVTREEVERIAPLPDSFDETASESIKQFILRDNGELNINMAMEYGETGETDGERDINFSYITYRLNEGGQWECVEEQMGYYMIQFSGGDPWDYIEELYRE